MMKPLSLCLAVLTSGCAFTVTTPNVTVDSPPPATALAIGAIASGIDVSEAKATRRYSSFRNDFYATLVSESKGKVAAFSNQKLHLLAALKFKIASEMPGAFIGVLSLYIPPLAFVPYESAEDYTVSYSIRDRGERVVYSKTLQNRVEGYIKGWFVGRIDAQVSLQDLQAEFAAKNAARLVLKDIFEHAAAITEAAQALSQEAAPQSESTPAATAPAAGAEWWQK